MRTALLCTTVLTTGAAAQPFFLDATTATGLDDLSSARVLFCDLNNDGRPDAVIDRARVFLNTKAEEAPRGFRFQEVSETGLPLALDGDCLVFADIDSDGTSDAVLTRRLDVNADSYTPPPGGTPQRTCWLRGNGDGTFGDPLGTFNEIPAAEPRTTACVAVGDVDRDGRLDLYLGNWYVKYGDSVEAYPNDLFVQTGEGRGVAFVRRPLDDESAGAAPVIDLSQPVGLEDVGESAEPTPEEKQSRMERDDPWGRPTYGAMIAGLVSTVSPRDPDIIELNYGRRWNRIWRRDAGSQHWSDQGKLLGFAGDLVTHGRYPAWLTERAKTDPRFARETEKPFRANGNTFDIALGDIDNDGDLDAFVAEITHGWAGESSDRSRFLVQQRYGAFGTPSKLSTDRLPPDPAYVNWNQGDLFCELADFDQDGRLDLLLSSGDYPDDQRLRLYRQQRDGGFADVTDWTGLDNDGSQQISLADVDLDGDLDILVGQTFNRMPQGRRAGRTPRVKLYLNQASERSQGNSLVLRLRAEPHSEINTSGLGAVVRVTADVDGDPGTPPTTQVRQLIGIGGHAGKQHDFVVHVGLGAAEFATVEIVWPAQGSDPTRIEMVGKGSWLVSPGGVIGPSSPAE